MKQKAYILLCSMSPVTDTSLVSWSDMSDMDSFRKPSVCGFWTDAFNNIVDTCLHSYLAIVYGNLLEFHNLECTQNVDDLDRSIRYCGFVYIRHLLSGM